MTNPATWLELAAKKLWPRVHPEPNTGCWLWEGAFNNKGYGQVWNAEKRRLIYAHRLAYLSVRGEIGPGLVVCHRCDFPPCVNPDHLFCGTIQDNSRDMVRKKRHPKLLDPAHLKRLQVAGGRAIGGRNLFAKGKHPTAKVTSEQVLAIRADARPDRIIAKDYGISRPTVSAIQARKAWSHV